MAWVAVFHVQVLDQLQNGLSCEPSDTIISAVDGGASGGTDGKGDSGGGGMGGGDREEQTAVMAAW